MPATVLSSPETEAPMRDPDGLGTAWRVSGAAGGSDLGVPAPATRSVPAPTGSGLRAGPWKSATFRQEPSGAGGKVGSPGHH